MDPTRFRIVAGQAAHDQWEAAKKQAMANGQTLVEVQEQQSYAGRVGAELVHSLYGWSLRYDSGLQNFDIIASSRRGDLDGTLEDAIKYAERWVAHDRTKRYAWVRREAETEDKR